MAAPAPLDAVISLAKRRGFVFQAGEIYGGSRSAWDYGPLGVELKENIRREWWQAFVRGRADMVGLDSSIILPKRVWEASGHVATFTDPLVECLSCHHRFRADHLEEEFVARKGRAPEGLIIPSNGAGILARARRASSKLRSAWASSRLVFAWL